MRRFFGAIFLLYLFSSLFSQPVIEKASLKSDVVYEKVYLHVDREVYSPTETIWFRVYLLSGISNIPIQGSKNIYIQLVNDQGKVVQERLLITYNGAAMGDIKIPYDISEGSYTLRAFTKYLENFGEESYFLKKIWISKMQKQVINRGGLSDKTFDLSFFPESGKLIYNANNKVAFKAIDSLGRGINLAGSIIDDMGNKVSAYHTKYLGMGSFVFLPQKGRKYFATIDSFPEYKYEFEDIREGGISMSVSSTDAEIIILLFRDITRRDTGVFHVIAESKDVQLLDEEVKMVHYSHELILPKSKFPLGISKITVKNSGGIVMAERILFVEAGFPDLIEVRTDQDTYASRDSVSVRLKLRSDDSISVSNGFSVAVVNRDYLNRDGYSNDIRSYLLLDSELKGPIESPASYFIDDNNISAREKLNLLMMVQGWRSYYWPDILAKMPDKLSGWDDIGISVSGTLKRLFRDQAISGGKVTIGPFSAAFIFLDTLTEQNGRFNFPHLYLRDSSKLIINAENERGRKNTEIFLDQMYKPDTMVDINAIKKIAMETSVPETFYSRSFSKLEAEKRYAIESGTYWLDEVEIVEEIPSSFGTSMKPFVEGMYGTPDHSINITDEDNSYLNIFDYLESNPVAGVIVNGNNSISIRGRGEPVYLVDGILVSKDFVETTSMGDIMTLDIIKSGVGLVAMGSQGGNGIISIYTRIGTSAYRDRYTRGRLIKKVEGFQWPNEFYSPRYTLENRVHPKPDYRATLYWNPMLAFNNSSTTFDFFTSDFQSEYVIIVEGVSTKGKILTGLVSFTVKN